MPVPGQFCRSIFGANALVAQMSNNNGPINNVMAAINAGWCARIMAPDTRDIASIWLNWFAVAAPGTVQLRIETIDATTGKPSGTLYDANAVLSFTPVVGWQQLTFATLPTTGLIAGAEYAVLLLTTVGGTTMTLRSHISTASYPTIVLTAADGTTRSNFAEVSSSTPILTMVFEDGSEEALACQPFATVGTTGSNFFGTNAGGLKFVVPAGVTLKVAGIESASQIRSGTPAGDLRVRIFNSSNGTVSGATLTIDKDSLLNFNNRRGHFLFPAVVSLPPGTYRIVLDSASSVNSSNCWTLRSSQARIAGNMPSGFMLTTTADVTAGAISWTDTPTDLPPLGLILDDVIGGSGGGLPLGRTVGGL